MSEKDTEIKHSKTIKLIATICCVILVGASAYLLFNFFAFDIVSNSICFLIILITFFINVEIVILSRRLKTAVLSIVIALILSLIIAFAGYYLRISTDALEMMTGVDTTVDTMGLYVEASSNVSSPEELVNADIGILGTLGRDLTDKGIEKLEEVIGENSSYIEHDDVASLSSTLVSGDVDAIFINKSYYNLLNEITENAHTNMKCIFETDLVRVLDFSQRNEIEDIDVTSEPFAVYISGNDNDGKLKANGTSDVNILMIVAPESKEILLVNTPRDYYVSLAEIDEDDKLTHAGMYGVDMSIKTLEKLYNISIPYYVRLNFTGFMDIIDALGGITVVSDVDFTVAEWHFVKGENELSGIESLAFARERYSFVEGDRQRGKNQQAVIKGIINKLSSPMVITNYAKIMKATSKAIETNMSSEDITALLNYQLSDSRQWDVENISVDGKGAFGECYSFPKEELSIIIPDKKTVEKAKEKISHYLSPNSIGSDKQN